MPLNKKDKDLVKRIDETMHKLNVAREKLVGGATRYKTLQDVAQKHGDLVSGGQLSGGEMSAGRVKFLPSLRKSSHFGSGEPKCKCGGEISAGSKHKKGGYGEVVETDLEGGYVLGLEKKQGGALGDSVLYEGSGKRKKKQAGSALGSMPVKVIGTHGGSKATKKKPLNAWMKHVAEVRKKHPDLIYKDVLILAKDTY